MKNLWQRAYDISKLLNHNLNVHCIQLLGPHIVSSTSTSVHQSRFPRCCVWSSVLTESVCNGPLCSLPSNSTTGKRSHPIPLLLCYFWWTWMILACSAKNSHFARMRLCAFLTWHGRYRYIHMQFLWTHHARWAPGMWHLPWQSPRLSQRECLLGACRRGGCPTTTLWPVLHGSNAGTTTREDYRHVFLGEQKQELYGSTTVYTVNTINPITFTDLGDMNEQEGGMLTLKSLVFRHRLTHVHGTVRNMK